MSLRKEKAARLKLAILQETLRLVGTKPYTKLYVEDVCASVKISKVTFFKYFPSKEDLLLYYYRLWCLARAVELKAKPRPGIQGIYFLIDRLSEEALQYPGLFSALIAHFGDGNRSPKPFPVKPEERKILYPTEVALEKIEIQSLEVMLETFVLEAIFKKEITRSSSTRDITHLFISVIYGSFVASQVSQQQPRLFIRKNVDLLLKGLNH